MAEKQAKPKKNELKESKFTKKQIYNSKRYKEKKDLINAVLEDKPYTLEEVDQLLSAYLKKSFKDKGVEDNE